MGIIDLHEELFEYLEQRRKADPSLVYRLRKTNRSNKLLEGYWFLGGENYLVIGFWKGGNYHIKAPNIHILCWSSGYCQLEINTTDSDVKSNLVRERLTHQPNFKLKEPYSNKATITLVGNGPKEQLDYFFANLWPTINGFIGNVIKKPWSFRGYDNIHDPFGFIEEEEFEKDYAKIKRIREELLRVEKEHAKIGTGILQQFSISNFGPIKKLNIEQLPKDTQWVFLTGENGVGKSSILRALTTIIAHRIIPNSEFNDISQPFNGQITIQNYKGQTTTYNRQDNVLIRKRKPLTGGFAAYGPMRLQTINHTLSKTKHKTAKSKSSAFNSLFNNDGYLLSIETEINHWIKESKIDLDERLTSIREILQEAIPNLAEVRFEFSRNSDKYETIFIERDNSKSVFPATYFQKLSSGYQSIFAMLSDMLVRLFQWQPDVNDASMLQGVVVIDELDVHLHPKFQKHLVEQITHAFPKVQFIASTHSPIPLLGAPKNSAFLKIERNVEQGVIAKRLSKLEKQIGYLLPNLILTSDIFDFDIFEGFTDVQFQNISMEDKYSDILANEKIRESLNNIDTSIFPDSLDEKTD